MASLLILEDSQVQLTRLKSDFRDSYPDLTVFPARSVAEAQLFLEEYDPIEFFLIDIFLPDGNGIDFLCDVRTIAPEAHTIIMTASPTPELYQHAQDLGVIQFFQKPLDISVLMEGFSKILGSSSKHVTQEETKSDSFKASLGGLSTIDIIQLKCLARATKVISFVRDNGASGKIHFQRGEIVHSQCSDGKSGLSAFNEIVSWKSGRVEESQEPIAEPTIHSGWESLLMDAVRIIDEGSSN